MSPNTPLARAQACVMSLHAVTDLVTQASTGNSDMQLVNPDHLAHLLNTLVDQLDDALNDIATPRRLAPVS